MSWRGKSRTYTQSNCKFTSSGIHPHAKGRNVKVRFAEKRVLKGLNPTVIKCDYAHEGEAGPAEAVATQQAGGSLCLIVSPSDPGSEAPVEVRAKAPKMNV